MSDNGRKMIYPITLSQQIKHFPFKFHWKYFPLFRESFFAMAISLYVFYKMEQLSYTPSNVKKYEEYLQKEEQEYQKHLHHLEGYYEDQHSH